MGKLKRHLNEVIRKTWNFSGRLKDQRDHEMNALIGLASEAGEALDVGKKYWFHTAKPFPDLRPALVKELGDVAYYFLATLDAFDISLTEVLKENREKLESRHPELGKVVERFGGGYVK